MRTNYRTRFLSLLQRRGKQAELEIDTILVEKGVVPLVREIVNAELDPSYAMRLPRVSGQGLAEVFDPRYEIPTAAKNTIKRMLLTMPGGSIGEACPRGAGKTTLLRSFSEDFRDDVKDRQVLSVMIDAPVRYNARDFVLHLFFKFCRSVLLLEKSDYNADDIPILTTMNDRGNVRVLVGLGVLDHLLVQFDLSIMLLVFGSILLLTALNITLSPTNTDSNQNSTVTSANTATEQPNTKEGDGESNANSNQTNTAASANTVTEQPGTKESDAGSNLAKIADALGLKAGTSLLWGIVLGGTGLMLVYISPEFPYEAAFWRHRASV